MKTRGAYRKAAEQRDCVLERNGGYSKAAVRKLAERSAMTITILIFL